MDNLEKYDSEYDAIKEEEERLAALKAENDKAKK